MPRKSLITKKEYNKNYYLKNKEKILKKFKKWYLKNKEKYLNLQKVYRLNNNKKISIKNKIYYLSNKQKIIKQTILRNKNKYLLNNNFRITKILRSRINGALKQTNKSKNTMKLLGITNINFLKNYLKSKFKTGMSWKKRGLIHIDHIIPCKAFDLTDPKQQAKCFHYTNLQPLWAHENLSKGAKVLKSSQ
jgi:hypothetical protein